MVNDGWINVSNKNIILKRQQVFYAEIQPRTVSRNSSLEDIFWKVIPLEIWKLLFKGII